jgi:hypothetical protein
MRTFRKYKANLHHDGLNVYSYDTKVARINDHELTQLGWWSVTTQKHINFAAEELGLPLNRNNY